MKIKSIYDVKPSYRPKDRQINIAPAVIVILAILIEITSAVIILGR